MDGVFKMNQSKRWAAARKWPKPRILGGTHTRVRSPKRGWHWVIRWWVMPGDLRPHTCLHTLLPASRRTPEQWVSKQWQKQGSPYRPKVAAECRMHGTGGLDSTGTSEEHALGSGRSPGKHGVSWWREGHRASRPQVVARAVRCTEASPGRPHGK